MTRVLLTVAVAAFFALCVFGMWRGWRARARRQASVLPPLPAVPTELAELAGSAELTQLPGTPLLPETTGVYVGSTTAGDWQDRVAVGDLGFRAAATLRLTSDGLLVNRVGAQPLWIPAAQLRGARTDRALAGKVMGRDGLLVVRWQLGDQLLDTGFRGDDKDVYQRWVAELCSLAGIEDQETVSGGTRA